MIIAMALALMSCSKDEVISDRNIDFSYGKDVRVYKLQPKLMDTLDTLQKEIHAKNCIMA